MQKIKYLLKKLQEHYWELGPIDGTKWFAHAVVFRTKVHFVNKEQVRRDAGNISPKEFNPETMIKKTGSKIFIFSMVPYYDIGGGQRPAQITKTMNLLGYEVYYIFGMHTSESVAHDIEVPTVSHRFVDDWDIMEYEKIVGSNDILIIDFPHASFFPFVDVAKRKKAKVIYENIDNWETSLGSNLFSKDNLNKILHEADLLIGTARPLVRQLEKYTEQLGIEKPIFYVPNAVDEVLFDPHRTYERPSDLVQGEKTLIYYGTLWGEWFDWKLIFGIAKKFPKYSIILIGEYGAISNLVAKAPKNIHFLGPKKQAELPAYLAYSDIALIPFKVDKIGKYVSPLKIFEYISMDKLVLSTTLPEVVSYPNTFSSNNIEDWCDYLRKKDISLDVNARDKFIERNSWTKRCLDILGYANALNNLSKGDFYNNISIVILNYNNMSCIERCLDSVLRHAKRYKYEVIVVDNGSKDGSFQFIRKKYQKRIRLLHNSHNGCSSGRNLGIKNAKHDYILFLDSDQFATNDYWIDSYLNIMHINSQVGAIGWAAGWVRTDCFGFSPIVDDYPYRYMPANIIARSDIDYLGTGGLFVKKETLQVVDYFDERFDPTCFEDTDLSFAIRNFGLKIYYSPYLGVYHLPHQTTHNSNDFKHDDIIKKHRKLFIKKWKEINPSLFDDCGDN